MLDLLPGLERQQPLCRPPLAFTRGVAGGRISLPFKQDFDAPGISALPWFGQFNSNSLA